jgi:hypothetical protein
MAVRKRQVIASIDSIDVESPATGVLRGLCHDGACVEIGAKVIEVDPRFEGADVCGLGSRRSAIARRVLDALSGRAGRSPH